MTKTPYLSLLALLAAGSTAPTLAQTQSAQTDSTLVREMTIEKEYTPIVRDAEKISRMPAVETPVANKTRIEYAAPTLTSQAGRELGTLGVGSVNTAYPFSNQRGYLMLEGGNLLTFKGDLGVRVLDTKSAELSFDFHHYSTNGRIDIANSDESTRRRINDNSLAFNYTHRWDNLELKTKIGYDYSYFNYYGVGLLDGQTSYGPEVGETRTGRDESTAVVPGTGKQTLSRLNLRFDLGTRSQNEWDWKFGFGYTGFNQKYFDLAEHDVALTMGLGRKLEGDWRFDTDLDINALIYGGDYSGSIVALDTVGFKKAGRARIAPYFSYHNGSTLHARLGLNVDMAFGLAPHFGLAPNFDFRWKAAEHFALYGSLTGGIEQRSLSALTKEYRYYAPSRQYRNSYTLADLRFGFQTNPAAGLMIDLSVGAGYTKNRLFLMSVIETAEATASDAARSTLHCRNSLAAYTADALSADVQLKFKYKWSNIFDFGFDMLYRHYNVDNDASNAEGDGIASYLPGWELKPNITLRPLKPLSIELAYAIKGNRKALVQAPADYLTSTGSDLLDPTVTRIVDLDHLQQLDAKVTYRLCDMLAINGSLNNLLFRKQSVWYGMPEPGFTFLVGGTLKF